MPASLSDEAFLGNDTVFQGRVQEAMITTGENIQSEAITVGTISSHIARSHFVANILQPGTIDQWKIVMSRSVAADASCIADATAAGTVVLTAANTAAQAALVTDAHISTALSGLFNAFFTLPGA